MRRLYFLAPDTTTAQAIVDDLLRARITWRHIHVLANHSVGLERLPEASLLQRSDVVHALERGVLFGAAAVLAMSSPASPGFTRIGRALCQLPWRYHSLRLTPKKPFKSG